MGASRPTGGGASETPRCYCLSLFKHEILRSSNPLAGGLTAPRGPKPLAGCLEAPRGPKPPTEGLAAPRGPNPPAGGLEAPRGPRPPRVAGAAGVVAPALTVHQIVFLFQTMSSQRRHDPRASLIYVPHMGLMGHPIYRLGTTHGTYRPPNKTIRCHTWDLRAILYCV